MSDVHTYIVRGRYNKKNKTHYFAVEVRALNQEQALEKAYSDIGSRHQVTRTMIKLDKIEEVENPEQLKDPVVLAFHTRDDFEIVV